MKQYLMPLALVLTLTAGGAAFAGPSNQAAADYENSLYDQPNPFNADEGAPARSQSLAAEPALDSASQQASTAGVERPQQKEPFYVPSQDPLLSIFGPGGPA
jgi:hypothetical protein